MISIYIFCYSLLGRDSPLARPTKQILFQNCSSNFMTKSHTKTNFTALNTYLVMFCQEQINFRTYTERVSCIKMSLMGAAIWQKLNTLQAALIVLIKFHHHQPALSIVPVSTSPIIIFFLYFAPKFARQS